MKRIEGQRYQMDKKQKNELSVGTVFLVFISFASICSDPVTVLN
jgi:hypothetical protein